MDISPLPTGDEYPDLAEGHQMLRQVRLSPAEGCFKVANTGFPFANRQQDLKAGRRSNGLK
jgi:hypothetical protein